MTINTRNIRSAVLLDFHQYKIKKLAHDYMQCYLKYGPEYAAMWAMERIIAGDKESFCRYLNIEMIKHGLNG